MWGLVELLITATQWAHHGQTTLKQRCINVIYVEITLFKRRLTMNYPLGTCKANTALFFKFIENNK